MAEERALSLKQVAELTGFCYSTIFAKRKQIGFRLPGSRVWRVLPSQLAELMQPSNNQTQLSLRVDGENTCPSAKIPFPVSGSSISARQAAKELDALLAQRTAKRRKSDLVLI
jgi:hypothetical protein